MKIIERQKHTKNRINPTHHPKTPEVAEPRQDMGSWSNLSCHSELVSESCNSGGGQILNRVQDDKLINIQQFNLSTIQLQSTPTPNPSLVSEGNQSEAVPGNNAPQEVKTHSLINLFTYSPKKAAFTLAEVLITLAIIGVVAAMTIPTLISKYQEKATVNKVLKAYSMVNQAYQLAKIDNGPITTWFSDSAGNFIDENGETQYSDATYDNMNIFYEKLSHYLKSVSITKASRTNNTAIYNLQGELLNTAIKNTGYLNLADGTSIMGGYFKTYCDYYACGDFTIDINGINTPPNTIGKDLFYFAVLPETILPMGVTTRNNIDIYCNINSKDKSNGYACARWIIEKKNMEYLHCTNLTWDDEKCN